LPFGSSVLQFWNAASTPEVSHTNFPSWVRCYNLATRQFYISTNNFEINFFG
jgi:hypothetical protein